MATYLYRLGRWSHDKRKTVLGFWLIVLVAVGTLAATMGGTKNNKFEVPGTESQQAQELLEQRNPAASGSFERDLRGGQAGTGRHRRRR
jgi:putative drug exporter of the RND superfamily